jgi:hypothetical protein
MLFFWMRQPRARPAFLRLLAAASPEERQIIIRTQFLLERQRKIGQMLLDGLVGKQFSAPLAFYLDKSKGYLEDMRLLLTRPDHAKA